MPGMTADDDNKEREAPGPLATAQRQAMDLAEAQALLQASHRFYMDVLGAIRGSARGGEVDLVELPRRLNEALTGFSRTDAQIRRWLEARRRD